MAPHAYKTGGGGPVLDMTPLQKRLHTVPQHFERSPDVVAKAARATALMDPIYRAERAAAEAKEANEDAASKKEAYEVSFDVACRAKIAYEEAAASFAAAETEASV